MQLSNKASEQLKASEGYILIAVTRTKIEDNKINIGYYTEVDRITKQDITKTIKILKKLLRENR